MKRTYRSSFGFYQYHRLLGTLKVQALHLVWIALMWPTLPLVAQQTYSASPETGITNFVTTPQPIRESTIEGTPFYHADFKPGDIMVDGEIVSHAAMRFDAYRNEIQVLAADRSRQSALLKRRNVSARIANEVFRIFPYEGAGGAVKMGYFIVRTSGSIKFLEKLQVTKRQSKQPATPYEKYRPSRYIWTHDFYICRENRNRANEVAIQVRLSKRSLLKMFPEKRDTLQYFVGIENLNLRHAEDVTNLIDHLNQLRTEK